MVISRPIAAATALNAETPGMTSTSSPMRHGAVELLLHRAPQRRIARVDARDVPAMLGSLLVEG